MLSPPDMELMARSLAFNPENGSIIRRDRRMSGGDGYAGTINKRGYRVICIGGVIHRAHRPMWFFVHGEWPKQTIDHINGDKLDNRISNLRLASVAQNMRNRYIQKNNSSGYKGVSFHRGNGKWIARIGINRRRISLGYFDNPDEAYRAYCNNIAKYHGEFARAK